MQQYEQIIVIGRSQLAANCAEMAARSNPGIKTSLFNVREERPPKAAAELDNLEYTCLEKTQIMSYLQKATDRTLVFSIMNPYIFPAEVVENPALRLINLHHALLPNHPGRNAEVWAIFEGDDVAGITWHMITAGVDEGEIILQKQVKITEHMTSFALCRAMNELVIESFPEILHMTAKGEEIKTFPQPADIRYTLRLSKEKPADGVLDLAWDIDKMYRFIRAMDYGILKVMGDPVVAVNGKKYTWKKYAIESSTGTFAEKLEMSPDEICIGKGGKELRLSGIREIDL